MQLYFGGTTCRLATMICAAVYPGWVMGDQLPMKTKDKYARRHKTCDGHNRIQTPITVDQ